MGLTNQGMMTVQDAYPKVDNNSECVSECFNGKTYKAKVISTSDDKAALLKMQRDLITQKQANGIAYMQ